MYRTIEGRMVMERRKSPDRRWMNSVMSKLVWVRGRLGSFPLLVKFQFSCHDNRINNNND
jgi:hypothetical protein